MALEFIMGSSGAGKTHTLFEHVIAESIAHPEKNYIVLVPEQFTMQTQKELVMRHPQHRIMNIDVQSFARLAYRILEETGHGGRMILDDEGKNLILRRMAGKLEGELRVLGSNIRKPGYISEVKSVISEFTQYSISPEEVDLLIKVCREGSYLSYKLKDIQTIYRAFEDYLADKYITKEEILDLLAESIGESKILDGAVIALDGFTGFTPIQNKVIRKLLGRCEKVIVTVTLDEKEDPLVPKGEGELFLLSKEMVKSLVRIAGEEKVEVSDFVRLGDSSRARFKGAPALAFLEKEVFRYSKNIYEEKQSQIRVYELGNPSLEADFAAQRVRSLVRQRGYRYREIAVIASDMNLYGDELERAFAAYDIPIFMDHKRNVLSNAFVEYLRSLLGLASQNFSYESVFRFLRTSMTKFKMEELDVLDNYVRSMGIRGYKAWQEKWIRRKKETSVEELELLNHLRVEFVEMVDPLMAVLKQKRKTVRDITSALVLFLEKEEIWQAVEAKKEQFEAQGDLALAKEYAQIYRVLMELFDKFVSLLGEEPIALKDYAQLLDAGLEEARIGVIPPGLDQVVAGDVQRTRLKDIRALIFLGVNDTLIPGNMMSGGLISERERQMFDEAGIALAPGARQKAYIQKYYLYLLMTKPTETLELVFSKVSQDGKSIHPAFVIGELKRMYKNLPFFHMDQYGLEAMELVPDKGKDYIIAGLHDERMLSDPKWQELYRWYMGKEEWRASILRVVDASIYRRPSDGLSKESARALFEEKKLSISRMEAFASCACAHFLTYGLGLKEREEYEFAALDFGNVFHSALEIYAKKIKERQLEWTQLDEEEQEELIAECVEESIADYNNTVLYSNARNAYMIPRMKRMAGRTIWALTDQLSRGEFKPVGSELTFSGGKIDRLDLCEDDDKVYVKVIDYKTGTKAFDLSAFYHGLQMQLVIYLREALDMIARRYPGKEAVPAGAFYYRIKDPVVERQAEPEKITAAILKELKMDGLVNVSEDVIEKLDHSVESSSLVIPYTKTKSGYRDSDKTLTEEQFDLVLSHAQRKREELTERIHGGEAAAKPYMYGKQTGCDYCKYKHICGFDPQIPCYEYEELPKYSKDEVLEKIRQEEE